MEVAVARVQLALNVRDVESASRFYEKLFGVPPAKRMPAYVNFAIGDPPLKLVLIEGEGQGGTLNHLGIEVESAEEVRSASERLAGSGLEVTTEESVACCYALQDKVWVRDPDMAPWEVYTVLEDLPAGAP